MGREQMFKWSYDVQKSELNKENLLLPSIISHRYLAVKHKCLWLELEYLNKAFV